MSVAGSWMQRVALSWLAYRLTGSSSFLGLLTFAGSAPAFLLAPLGGVIADRVNRHHMLIVAQSLELLQASLLAWIAFSGRVTPGWLLLLSLVLGVLNAFENPARQSFFVEMVEPEDLSNAIALNSSQVSVARVLGPAAAGIALALWGEGVCFALNALSFLAVIVALLLMRVKPRPIVHANQQGWALMREALAFVHRTPSVRNLLGNFFVISFAGSPYLTLLPMLAGPVLHTGPKGLGWLVSATGAGAIATSLILAARTGVKGLHLAMMLTTAMFGVALVVLGLSRSFPLSMVMMLLVGGGWVYTLAATQTMLQVSIREEMRGRVMSFYSLIFLGVSPFGSLFAGLLADRVGAPVTIALGGALCIVGAVCFWRQPQQQELGSASA